jgi:hypothetical protein
MMTVKKIVQKTTPQTMTNTQASIEANFSSYEELIRYLDELLERLAWAYTGKRQHPTHMVNDYDVIEKLGQAMIEDLQGLVLEFNPPPLPPPEPDDYNVFPSFSRPPVTSVAKAHRIAQVRGIEKYEVVIKDGRAVLLLDWTEQDFERYYAQGGKVWGSYSHSDGRFVARLLHLM